MYSETTINLVKAAFEGILSMQEHRKVENTIAEMLDDRYWDAPTTPEKKRRLILMGYLFGWRRKEIGKEVFNFYSNPLYKIKAIMLGSEDYRDMPLTQSNQEKIELGRKAVEAICAEIGAHIEDWDRY